MGKDLKTIKDELLASPMFNLSLSSKELFHSNFLAWLGNNQETKTFFVNVIKDMTDQKVELSNDDSWTVEREEKNFDLCIKSVVDYLLIIENKVKSIPRKKQLDEYKGKIEDYYKDEANECSTKFLLLTLAKQFPHKEEIDKDVWVIKTYADLAKAMENRKECLYGYYLSLVEDYLGFIGNIYTLVEEWQENNEFANAQDLNGLEKLSDLHAKIQFSSYCVMLKELIAKNINDVAVFDDEVKNNKKFKESIDAKKVYIKVNWGFASNGKKGTIDVAIPVTDHVNPKIILGCCDPTHVIKIQVEERSYRHVIETTEKSEIYDLDKFCEYGLRSTYTDTLKWFSKDPSKASNDICYGNENVFNACLYPRTQNSLRNKNAWPFKTYMYGNKINFLYQSKDIRDKATVADVLNNIVNEIKRLLDKLQKA